jgi:superfamily II DNA helicase RecQ
VGNGILLIEECLFFNFIFFFIAHLCLPKTIEAYYQETGHAGRDGQPANAWLAYGVQDVISMRQMS